MEMQAYQHGVARTEETANAEHAASVARIEANAEQYVAGLEEHAQTHVRVLELAAEQQHDQIVRGELQLAHNAIQSVEHRAEMAIVEQQAQINQTTLGFAEMREAEIQARLQVAQPQQ